MCTTKKYLVNLKNWLNIGNNNKRFDMGDKAVASHKALFGSLLTYILVFISQFSSLNPLSHISYSNFQFSINSVPLCLASKLGLSFQIKKQLYLKTVESTSLRIPCESKMKRPRH